MVKRRRSMAAGEARDRLAENPGAILQDVLGEDEINDTCRGCVNVLWSWRVDDGTYHAVRQPVALKCGSTARDPLVPNLADTKQRNDLTDSVHRL